MIYLDKIVMSVLAREKDSNDSRHLKEHKHNKMKNQK